MPREVVRRIGLALLSSVLLVVSFPNFNQFWCAWIALVPWLILLRDCPPRAAFWWSYLIGVLFFLVSMWWLIHVTVVGWVVLCSVLALYFALFGWFVAAVHGPRSTVHGLFLIPSAWVSLEFFRSHLLSGFGWNLLAYSQTPWGPLIQLSDVTGAWGVSFLIVMVNSALVSVAINETPLVEKLQNAVIAGICLTCTLWYGFWRIPHAVRAKTAKLAVVQGNIMQDEKWNEAYAAKIFQRYTMLTEAAATTNPDLIVWPETSVPGYLGIDEGLTQRVTALARQVKHPLLVGAPVPTVDQEGMVLRNSALLVSASGDLLQRYDKIHLVPFGEFVPFERALPWVRNILPPIGDFSPGRDYTVFHLGSRLKAQGSRQEQLPPASSLQPSAIDFSVLICFEDIFPELARRFVRNGAQMLLVITNDAWFGPTAAAYQHAQASTFRAVELRVPVARAANTGWSGCIDPAGRWLGNVQDSQGRALFVEGTHTCGLPLGPAHSFYLRWGDWFAGLCLIISLAWLAVHWPLKKPTRPTE